MKPLRLLLLASGRGSHAVNLIQATRDGRIAGSVVRLISDRPGAGALQAASALGVPVSVLDGAGHAGRLLPEAEERLLGMIAADRPDLIALCGFMRLLSASFLERAAVPVLNVHPSLLPEFPGLDAQRRAVDAGAAVTGATVHYVDAGMDSGPIVAQAKLAIRSGETPEELAERLLPLEHRLYVEAIQCIQRENS
ncbi:MAG TPA: phosphoribosylglycinamide formyltransferase [Candidatus Limnocylindrales bacterium]|nr:phosphoribosylglycinamide formyltransferase [Candidatus Limnocylindrales bacterium]